MTPTPDDDLYRFFDALAARWDAMQPADRDAHLARLLAPHAALFAGARQILDVGSGTGAFLPHLFRLAPDACVTTIDLSGVMLTLSRASGRAQQVCAWLRADAHHLPLSGEQMHVITCHDSFAHFEDRPAALREFHRVLAAQGRLLVLHDISRERVNTIHHRADAARVQRHLLPPLPDVLPQVEAAGFRVLAASEAADHYLIAAQRCG